MQVWQLAPSIGIETHKHHIALKITPILKFNFYITMVLYLSTITISIYVTAIEMSELVSNSP